MGMKRTTKRAAKTFTPAAWQWDPASVVGGQTGGVQMWSAAGSMMGVITVERARELISAKAFFAGSSVHICQVHDRIAVAS